MSPLELAEILLRVGDTVRKDDEKKLFVIDGTVPPTECTLPEYEAALKILELREKRHIR